MRYCEMKKKTNKNKKESCKRGNGVGKRKCIKGTNKMQRNKLKQR